MRFIALLFVLSLIEAIEYYLNIDKPSEKTREFMAALCVLMLLMDIVELIGAL